MVTVKIKRVESPRKEAKTPLLKKTKDKNHKRNGERLRKEIEELRESLARREAELNQLKEQVRYKNQLLASKDLEFESYKRISDEKIILLEAKIKELESKLKKSHLQKKRGALEEHLLKS